MTPALKMPRFPFGATVFLLSTLSVILFLWVIFDVIGHGMTGISFSFLFDEPQFSGRAGGIGPILISTSLIMFICAAAVLPLGLGTAFFLADWTRTQKTWITAIRYCLDVLAGVPSIVYGLFGNALFVRLFGWGFSIMAGGLTLACMVLPYFVRVAEQALRQVPPPITQGADSLGLSRYTTMTRLQFRMAVPGIFAAFILAMGRALAETAALLFTSGYVDRWPESVWDSGRALSVHILDLAMNIPGGNANAYGSAFVLLFMLVAINTLARLVEKRLRLPKS